MAHKYLYLFSEGNGNMRELLGGKGANLAEMTILGMPVPQGFTISTEACTRYYDDGEKLADEIQASIFEYLLKMEEICGKKFGDRKNPLLVSVRSGARASMPGMMDTILNLGLNDDVAEGMCELTGNPRFVYDSYRRFVQMYSDVVMEVPKSRFEQLIDRMKAERGVTQDTQLTTDDLKELVKIFKGVYEDAIGRAFPSDPREQLMGAVEAVFRSWNNPRAIVYRRMNDIPNSWGTAVNVQCMVFGNMGFDSGTGVAFTRDPSTGERRLYGEYLMNAQGEDVVAGVRTPQPIETLKDTAPAVYEQFVNIATTLEKHYKDMQDMEFTIERGKLYMLQTRNGKRTAQAALKVAVDLVDEGMCSREEALLKVEPRQLDSLLHPQFDSAAIKKAKPAAKGLPASPGAGCGRVVFTAEEAVELSRTKEPVILVRLETSPEDIEGMNVSQGILTVRGGMTSHAAVVARGMGRCCVSGCGDIVMHEAERFFMIGDTRVNGGDFISLDGTTGNIYIGKIPTVDATVSGNFATFMGWADEYRRLGVRANADTPKDARQAIALGAEGIGLCRTEHMFFDPARIPVVREMIVSKDETQRRKALDKLLPMQRSDFEAMYKAMEGRPMTVRLLDPPLHEFLPHEDSEILELAKDMGISFEELKSTVNSLHEFNPMLGHRGVRLAITYPEIAEMQTRAIVEAAINVKKETGIDVVPEIMIPLIGFRRELIFIKAFVKATADKVIAESGVELRYMVGTMIEVPRAALIADRLATEAEFFSFGTNDLTQMTLGFSRDDSSKFLESYYAKRVFDSDPFARIDQNGVGRLIDNAAKLGRGVRPNIKLGICGEHGGDPSSVEFCDFIGLDYVSCSPFRVPIARLAAAQAAIKHSK